MYIRRDLAVSLSLCFSFAPACSSSGCPPAPPAFDISGMWSITEEITSATGPCASLVGDKSTVEVPFSVTGNILTIIVPPRTITVNLNGNTASWADTNVDGTTTYSEQGSGTFTQTTFTATTNWQVSNSSTGASCTGTSKLTGARTSSSTINSKLGGSPDTPTMHVYVIYDDNSVVFGRYQNKRVIPAPRSLRLIDRIKRKFNSAK